MPMPCHTEFDSKDTVPELGMTECQRRPPKTPQKTQSSRKGTKEETKGNLYRKPSKAGATAVASELPELLASSSLVAMPKNQGEKHLQWGNTKHAIVSRTTKNRKQGYQKKKRNQKRKPPYPKLSSHSSTPSTPPLQILLSPPHHTSYSSLFLSTEIVLRKTPPNLPNLPTFSPIPTPTPPASLSPSLSPSLTSLPTSTLTKSVEKRN